MESKHAEKRALYTVLTAAATVVFGFLFVPAVTAGIMYITQGKNAGNAIAGVVLLIVYAAVVAAVMLLWRKIGKSTFWRWMSASGGVYTGACDRDGAAAVAGRLFRMDIFAPNSVYILGGG